ncbi:hypothetical protein F4824DRAFT_458324 [Ustulina deusta]|nr:hypothetical protein F4823DRAFT_620085 [Ustulina deusta]KAI3338643.1 hypothetical protein F4824DRAFT_458324 [Ustulina deusta]
MCSPDLFLGVVAILFPPIAVWVKCGLFSADSIINILLCLLGYIPGLLHAWYIIAKFPETYDYERVPHDYEHGNVGGERVTYVIVPAPHPHPQPNAQPQYHPQQQPKHAQPVNYGTASAAPDVGSSSAHPPQAASTSGGDNSERAPPSYSEAVKGDHKIQSDE